MNRFDVRALKIFLLITSRSETRSRAGPGPGQPAETTNIAGYIMETTNTMPSLEKIKTNVNNEAV